jgi:hypothetical protein
MSRAVAGLLLVLCASACAAPLPSEDAFSEYDSVEVEASPVGANLLGTWVTDHHDPQNTGRSPVFFNVSEYNGACQVKVTEPFLNSYFASSGATSTDGRKLFLGE